MTPSTVEAPPAVDDFLVGQRPELGPDQAFGDQSVDLAFGPLRVRVEGIAQDQAKSLKDRFPRLDTTSSPAGTARLELRRVPSAGFRPAPSAWHEYRLALEPSPDELLVTGRHLRARLDAPREAACLWTCLESGPEWMEAVENTLRVLASYRALQQGGLIVHSAAIARGRRALLFPAASGSGKSTLCGLATQRGWRVLSDELNFVHRDEVQGLAVTQLPFAGDFGRTELPAGTFSLTGVGFLCKSASERVEALAGPSRLAARLTASAPYVNGDPSWQGPLLDTALDLSRNLPGFEYSFPLTATLAPLDAHLEAAS